MSYDLLYMILVVISNLTNFLPDFDKFGYLSQLVDPSCFPESVVHLISA